MCSGKPVFTQVTGPLPWHGFPGCTARYHGNRKVKSFICANQYRCVASAQLTYRSGLRDIEACLRVHPANLYHMGIRGRVSRNTLAHANAVRGRQSYADFARRLIHIARHLHSDDHLPGLNLGNAIYALDYSTFDLCLSLFPRAPLLQHQGRCQAPFGTSENTVKTQIWIAVSVYVLIAIIRKRLKLEQSLYALLPILSLASFARTVLNHLLAAGEPAISPARKP